jgi:hypothetical protein
VLVVVVAPRLILVAPLMVVPVGRLEVADSPGNGHAGKQGQRKGGAVVRMESDLRQEVGQRNTQEHPRGKRQGTADNERLLADNRRQAQREAQGPQRAH